MQCRGFFVLAKSGRVIAKELMQRLYSSVCFCFFSCVEPISAVPPLSVGISWKVLTSIVIAVTTAALFL